jgi:AraC-like DNA-binding protein
MRPHLLRIFRAAPERRPLVDHADTVCDTTVVLLLKGLVSSHLTKLQSPETVIFAEYPEIPGVEFLSGTHVMDKFDAHMHDCFTIGVTLEGSEHFWCRGAEHVAALGDIALLNPYDVHKGGPGPAGCWSYSTIYARSEVLEAAKNELFKPSHRTLQFSTVVVTDPPVAGAVGALQTEMYRADSALERQGLVLSLLSVLVARYSSVTAAPRKIQLAPLAVRKVRDFIHANYADNVSLDDLSECSGLSPFHLLRIFRRAIGMPPHAYLRQIRVEQAKQLLAVGTPISEAAAATGFVDQSHLNRVFKRILGMTPGVYAAVSRPTAIKSTAPTS